MRNQVNTKDPPVRFSSFHLISIHRFLSFQLSALSFAFCLIHIAFCESRIPVEEEEEEDDDDNDDTV
jgi:hypothetical protein